MSRNAVLYGRESEADELGVTRQLQAGRKEAKRRQIEVVDEFHDNDKSAREGSKPRKDFDRMLRRIEAGGVDIIIAWDLTRLTRNRRDEVRLVEVCQKYNVLIILLQGSDIDASKPIGRFLLDILGSVARHEIELKGARQVAANQQRANLGLVGWTVRPFGYDRDDDGIRVIAEEKAAVVEVVARVMDGATLTAAVKYLNTEGLLTTRGNPWQVTTLRALLMNPRLSGRATYRGDVVADGGWPKLLDPAVHDELMLLLMDPKRRTATDTRVKYLLSGIALCGVCGGLLFASPAHSRHGGSYQVYRCRTPHLTRRLDYVDATVVMRVITRLERPDAVELLDDPADGGKLAAEAADIRQRKASLAELVADGTLDKASVRKQAARLDKLLADVEARRDTTVGAGALARLVESIDVPAEWERTHLLDKRSVIRTLMTVTVLPVVKGTRFDPTQVDFLPLR